MEGVYQADLQYRARAAGQAREGAAAAVAQHIQTPEDLVEAAAVVAVVVVVEEGERPS